MVLDKVSGVRHHPQCEMGSVVLNAINAIRYGYRQPLLLSTSGMLTVLQN